MQQLGNVIGGGFQPVCFVRGPVSRFDVEDAPPAGPDGLEVQPIWITRRVASGDSVIEVLERDLDPTGAATGIPTQWATRPLWLLRGSDRSGRNDLKVGHPPLETARDAGAGREGGREVAAEAP